MQIGNYVCYGSAVFRIIEISAVPDATQLQDVISGVHFIARYEYVKKLTKASRLHLKLLGIK